MPGLSSLLFLVPVILVVAIGLVIGTMFRRVVPTNMVHIVQSKKKTTSYGTKQAAGNVYYRWPSMLPGIGVTVIRLPVSNFDLSLKDYEAYDKDRVPFVVDVTAFFRIEETSIAAQRVEHIQELHEQLLLIVQGAVRKVLASDNIDAIMLERSKFGDMFTDEVQEQLKEWGVKSVKAMELMDIRDGHDSKVIHNIMAKKTSHIEMESRTEVAQNHKLAQTAEIEAKKSVDVRQQEADEAVGQRTAEQEQAVGIAKQKSAQAIRDEEKITREKDMAVKRVEQVKAAEIKKDEKVVEAEQDQQTMVIRAEGELSKQQKEAAGIEAIGKSKGEAEKAMQLAPVEAQIKLAKEIGSNEGYQKYLAILKAIDGYIAVGSKQAEALQKADVKVIANTGNAVEGASGAMNLFTSSGGTNLAGSLEALAQSPLGEAVLAAIGVQGKADAPDTPALATPEPKSPAPVLDEPAPGAEDI